MTVLTGESTTALDVNTTNTLIRDDAANLLEGGTGEGELAGIGSRDIVDFCAPGRENSRMGSIARKNEIAIHEAGIGTVLDLQSHLCQRGSDMATDFSAIRPGDKLVIENRATRMSALPTP
jgi:hypothetical protein